MVPAFLITDKLFSIKIIDLFYLYHIPQDGCLINEASLVLHMVVVLNNSVSKLSNNTDIYSTKITLSSKSTGTWLVSSYDKTTVFFKSISENLIYLSVNP